MATRTNRKKKTLKEIIKRRPPVFWWILANLLAAAFAVASWTVCLYVFHFPERAGNYELLRKLKRLEPVASFAPLEAPDGTSYEADGDAGLLSKFWTMDDEQLAAHNRHFKRNYITNFAQPEVLSYVEGAFRVLNSQPLAPGDFFHPGLAVRAQAIVQGPELAEPSPYPVYLELLLPTTGDPPAELLKPDRILELKKLDHRAMILHASKVGTVNEPAVCLTVVPIAYRNYQDAEGNSLPLADPDPLNVEARFPVMAEHRND